MPLSFRNLLSVEDITTEDIEMIMDTAASFAEVGSRPIKKVPALRGKTVATLFFEASTRTRVSFELAAKRLSADTVSVAAVSSSVSKGETIRDTAQTLEAMGVDAIVLRHPAPGSALRLSRFSGSVIINGGDGAHQHPTQALLDLFALRQKIGRLAGRKILVVGDVAFSRVARSTISLFSREGAEVVAVGPPTLLPVELGQLGCRIAYSLDDEIGDCDVIYLLRMQFERQTAALVPSLAEYCRHYSLTAARLAKAKPEVIVMHPGPMNRGIEISEEVANLPASSAVLDQVNAGVSVRMALLYLMLGGRDAIAAS